MRTMLAAQWQLTDQALVARYRQENEAEVMTSDGYDSLTVISLSQLRAARDT